MPSGYHHNGFVATHALGHMVYMMHIMSLSVRVATTPLWWSTGGHIVFIIEYIYIYSIFQLIHFSLLLNPAMQRMGNTRNIQHPRCMEKDESHLHFIFYWKLSKVTSDYISKLINLNYFFNLPFKLSVKTIKIGSFSILWWCSFKKSTHTFRSDTHASLQSLS